MSDDTDRASKTEDPTERQLKKARESGNFAKAEEIQVTFGLAASFLAILFYSDAVGLSLARAMRDLFGNITQVDLSVERVAQGAQEGALQIMLMLLPIFVLVMLFAILAGGLQSRFRLSPKALKLSAKKLNPLTNMKQKYGKQAYVKFGVDLLKLIAVGTVIAFALHRVTQHPIFYTTLNVVQILGFIKESTLYILSLLVFGVGAIALINFLYQKQKVMGDLRMTKQEIKDEMKQQDGDPLVKNARRQLARKLMERQMFAEVPHADVVITNPTHYAVALRYDRSKDAAPFVLAKGKNLIAQKIKRIAAEHGVPMVENRPAAQALYKIGQTGQTIPPHLFQAVAEILAYVYRRHRSFFNRRRHVLNR